MADETTETALQENQTGAEGEQNAGNQASDGGSGTEVADELNALLGEVEIPKEEVQAGTDDESDLKTEFSALREEVQGIRDTASRAEADDAINDTVDTIIEAHDHLTPDSKDAVEALLHHMARKDPRIDAAFQKRHADPGAWAKISTALGVKVANSLKSPDSSVTAAKTAAREAAQGISTTLSSDDEDTGPSQAVLAQEFESGKIWDRLQEQTGYRRHS